ncbi:DUF1338 domain-containing protein [Halioxenophilus aromaticivorans]|uniref:2-oxoadipate dioxygenase/decarboxylase n=1 Tax=Halioxenophilus aromaticivorans TaxID=1306992 RepID=A0AAV3U9M8_9ALTE
MTVTTPAKARASQPELDVFFHRLWQQYIEVTPQAAAIARMFAGDTDNLPVNDHVAFRTTSNSAIAMQHLEPVLAGLGYVAYDQFRFEQKKLNAKAFKHTRVESAPKIFLSELQTHELPPAVADVVGYYMAQVTQQAPLTPEIFSQGRLWHRPTLAEYRLCSAHSEYAAWLLTMGLRANHFTVSVNHLPGKPGLEGVNQRIKAAGFKLNSVGGETKGGPGLGLQQSATLADRQPFRFGCGAQEPIPTCFYEFALRHAHADGQLFDSFIEGNADKIFDSTNAY